MKKATLFLLILFTLNCQAKKQGQAAIDSMKIVLQAATADTQRIQLMGNISFTYNTINPNEGIKYGTEALALAQKINWEKGIGLSRYYRAANYLNTSKLPEALEDYLASLTYFEKAGDNSKLAGTLSNIGSVYGYLSKNDKALEYFFRALKINEKYIPRSSFLAANLGNIGIIYYDKADYAKALEYNLKSLELSTKYHLTEMIPNAYLTISGIYLKMDSTLHAYAYAQQALSAAKETGDLNVIANSYTCTSSAVLTMIKNNDKAFIDKYYLGNRELALHDVRLKLDSAVSILKEIDNINLLSSAYENLALLEEYNGNYKAALDYQKQFKNLNDTIFNSDKNEKILQTSMQYEFDKKEAATQAEQEKKDIRQRNIRNSIALGLIGALVFGLVVYQQRNKIAKARKRSDELLLNILPEEVAEELKSKGSANAKQFDEVSVMFTDFKGFTQISEKLSPAELVAEIHTCFKAFDHIITKHNIEKIKTIGDAYMCAGGLPVANASHASDIVKAALEIQQFMQEHLLQRQKENKALFEIRIGIHSGPVVAGIVGVKKFAYDIWGDTVNLASRMESSGEAGKVNISGSTYKLIQQQFKCTHRGKIQAKNKGEMDMYFVEAAL